MNYVLYISNWCFRNSSNLSAMRGNKFLEILLKLVYFYILCTKYFSALNTKYISALNT